MGCPVRPQVTAAIWDSLYTAAMAVRISCGTARVGRDTQGRLHIHLPGHDRQELLRSGV